MELGRVVDECIAETPSQDFRAVGRWLDGKWDANPRSMTDLLWRLQCSRWVVTAAHELHRRGSVDHIAVEDDETPRWMQFH